MVMASTWEAGFRFLLCLPENSTVTAGPGPQGTRQMKRRELRSPEERVGTLGNTALPPPAREETPSTERLLRRALVEGDHRALETAVHELRPEMLRMAAGHVRSVDDAEDVVQDTWIAALAGIHRFEGRASLKTWLLRILTYRARTTGRLRRRFVPLSHLAGTSGAGTDACHLEPFLVSATPDPEQAAIGQDLRDRVQRALVDLPSRQREVVRLRDLEEWSSGEVNARLRLSTGNQRVLLHRGRLRLREAVAH